MTLSLVGSQTMAPAGSPLSDDTLAFFSDFFQQAKAELAVASPTRLVGFTLPADETTDLLFIGVQAEEPRRLPAGMVTWSLTEQTWRVNDTARPIRWLWTSVPDGEPLVGEFCLASDLELDLGAPSGHVRRGDRCRMTANSPIQLDREYADLDRVVLSPYDPLWPKQFSAFAWCLQKELGEEFAPRLEHIGSTAIPGMTAKPIIDVLVEVPSLAEARRKAIPLFNRPNWEYWGYDDHPVFVRREGFMGRRTHHVHFAPQGHREWEAITFRDHLRTHREDAGAYAALKQRLAERHGTDREAYTKAKTEFVHAVLHKATGGGTGAPAGDPARTGL